MDYDDTSKLSMKTNPILYPKYSWNIFTLRTFIKKQKKNIVHFKSLHYGDQLYSFTEFFTLFSQTVLFSNPVL